MPSAKNANHLTLTLLSCGLLALYLCGAMAMTRSEPVHGALLGDDWLRMTPSEKFYFVEGYRKGSLAGHDDACELFASSAKEQLPPISTGGIALDPCQGRARSWAKGTEQVVKQIDEYYSRFPSDRRVHVTNVLQNLSDQSSLTIEQIHALGKN